MKLINKYKNTFQSFLNVLNELLLKNYPGLNFFESGNSIKVILKELEKFTVTYISFEKSKIILRHNIKSSDNLIPVNPNLEFINRIITEILKLGFELSVKENDELQSTCRIELKKRN